jgi:hypothetical protein
MEKKGPRSISKAANDKTRQVATFGKVGRGVPPEACKWQPGQSGNPSGRPSEPKKVLVSAVKEMLAEIDPKLQKSMFQRLIEQAGRRALQGSYRHLELLLSYGLGKPLQAQISVNREITAADRLAGMTDEEIEASILEKLVKAHNSHKVSGAVQ